ncbi:hypothetical protein SDJN03_17284, partial [Cucurbita argyrosperma subsp. sororia]
MSSIGQNILMALALTLNQFASSNVQSVQRNKPKTPPTTTATTSASSDIQRRGLILSAAVAAAVDSRTDLLKRYLKKSEENKEKNDKERLESFYKRNYKDYFEFVEGSLKNKDELSEAEKVYPSPGQEDTKTSFHLNLDNLKLKVRNNEYDSLQKTRISIWLFKHKINMYHNMAAATSQASRVDALFGLDLI